MIALTRRALLALAVAALLLVLAASAALAKEAEADLGIDTLPSRPEQPTFWLDNGFARLGQADPELVGTPVSPEMPGDEPDSIIQLTTTGLLYWRGPGHPMVHFDGTTRTALVNGSLVSWKGDALDPPAPKPVVVAPSSGQTASSSVPAASGRVACVIGIESHGDPSAVNPRSGASGLGQFLQSTWLTTPQGKAGMSRLNPSANAQAIAWMIANGRANEFDAVRYGGC